MDYFLDTNAMLGYVFCTDPWNTPAVTVFKSYDRLHYSVNVDSEFQRNFIKFSKEQKQFFFKICDELEDSGFKNVDFNVFSSLGLSVDLVNDFAENKKESCLRILWNISNKDNVDVIKVKILVRRIRSFARNFDSFLFDRKLSFEQKVMLAPLRVDDYSEIFDELEKVGIHEEDRVIILDAHDLACRECLCLNFVTSDDDVFELSPLVSDLNIDCFLHLKDF